MQVFYSIPLFLIGSGLLIYSVAMVLKVWPRDFFISEKGRIRRSTKGGITSAFLTFGIFLLMMVYINEKVTSFQLIKNLCFFGTASIFIGIIGGVSTYNRLSAFTRSKDDIGTIRDE